MLGCKVFRKVESVEAYSRRHQEILSAAERCFAKSGFHRTTIQTIAADAGMSVGNVYRYFASKDSVVEALVGRDQAKMAQDFDSLGADDLMGAFAALMRRQIVECSRERIVLWLEICSEAARNPAIAAVTRAHERAISTHLTTFFARVVAERGAAVDPQALARLVITLFGGLMVAQAPAPDVTRDAGVDQMLAVVTAAVEGRVALEANTAAQIGVYA